MSRKMPDDTCDRSFLNPLRILAELALAFGLPCPTNAKAAVSVPMPSLRAEGFRERYLLKELFRKYPGFNLGIDRSAAAIEAFQSQERRNRAANERLERIPLGEDPQVLLAFRHAKHEIASVLGKFSWSRFMEGLRFGPGATSSLTANNCGLDAKLCGVPEVTSDLLPLAEQVLSVLPQWAYTLLGADGRLQLAVNDCDIVTTVPKNALTDRTIAKQPDINVVFQLATAYVMRGKLAKVGINLNDQTINQELARQASIDGRKATVDLRNASSSMVYALVWRLIGDYPVDHSPLSPTWWRLLNAMRTQWGRLPDGREHEYALFSQMGNGCTFELESLIFWALSRGTCAVLGLPPDVSVYGDDLIVPVECYDLLVKVFDYAGLQINSDKTFANTEGPLFRESCGKHYLDGIDVTPVYVTESFKEPMTLTLLANNLKRWAKLPYGLDGRVKRTWTLVYNSLPKRESKTYIPYGENDDGVILDFDECRPSVARSKAIRKVTRLVGPDNEFGYPTAVKLPVHIAPQYLGLKSQILVEIHRKRLPDDVARLLIWHYLKYQRAYRWPSTYSLLEKLDAAFAVYQPYRPTGLKAEWRRKSRVVTQWVDAGPWL